MPQIGAPRAWQAGYTGEGVKVAVLDTGIDASHPDVVGRLDSVRNFTEAADANDTVGHGTHVASTIAGTGAASDGRYRGVAPDANLLIGKVCPGWWCPESAIVAGMQWAAESGATVANLSLGGQDSPGVDALEEAVNQLTDQYGTLFVISAGNAGADESVGSPASADAALAVGAVDKSDQLAYFSSWGPRVGDGALKPEITAPGVDIVAANAKDGYLGEPGEKYTTLSGTSMAAPHVAGSAALLAQQHPDWDADELKATLVGSAKRHPELTAFQQGAGRVDVARAVGHAGYALPPVVSAGRVSPPHDPPVARTVTYHNPTSQPVSYQLALHTLGLDGQPAPDGMFRVSAEAVTVPAGGAVGVEVTVDTQVPGLRYGRYSAWLTATAGDAQLVIPIAVTLEPPHHNLTFNVTDRNGAATDDYMLQLWNTETQQSWWVYHPNSSVTLRLPEGRYHIQSMVNTGTGHSSLLTWSLYELSRNGTVALDARAAKPNRITLDDRDVRLSEGQVSYNFRDRNVWVVGWIYLADLSAGSSAHLGPELSKDQMYSGVTSTWAIPGPDGDMTRSPRTYHLVFYQYGRLVSGFSRHVVKRDLAAVRTAYHGYGPGKQGFKAWSGEPTQARWGLALDQGVGLPVPFTRTEYLNPDGVRWSATLSLYDEWQGDGYLMGMPVTYRAGHRYQERWNNAVSGPGFPPAPHDGWSASRLENAISCYLPMRTDAAGHPGVSWGDTGSTRLYRNGELVGDTNVPGYGDFTVPTAEADYRLTVDADRADSRYSVAISAAWTFHSGYTTERRVLPLLAVGVAPPVDLENRARAGRTQRVPVTVWRADQAAFTLTRLTVEVSFDDGVTWRKVRLIRPLGLGWQAMIQHPKGVRYVSLRSRAADRDGNTVTETIIRAYGLR